MSADDHDAKNRGYASPPCFMHELDSAYLGLEAVPDEQQLLDVARWRKAERERLLALRQSIPESDRIEAVRQIARRLGRIVDEVQAETVGVFWPIRGEPDLRGWMLMLHYRFIECSLPAIRQANGLLEFLRWKPGISMHRSAFGIFEPEGGLPVVPDILVVPLLGFDRSGHRLGNGGGYYDRTLAGMQDRPHLVGVGFSTTEIATIYPQPHDIALDRIVTESESFSIIR